MAKLSANYEAVFILDATLGEEATAALVTKFKTLVEQNGTPDRGRRVGQASSGLSHQRQKRGLLRSHDLQQRPLFPPWSWIVFSVSPTVSSVP